MLWGSAGLANNVELPLRRGSANALLGVAQLLMSGEGEFTFLCLLPKYLSFMASLPLVRFEIP